MTDAMFDLVPVAGEPRRPVAELRRIHDDGVRLLTALLDLKESTTTYRVRLAEDIEKRPNRRFEVSIRTETPKREEAAEWLDLMNGRIKTLVYGFLGRDPDRITDYALVDGHRLVEDIINRPLCMVRAGKGKNAFNHHAPGGATFIVVDLRRLRPETIRKATFDIPTATAPTSRPETLF